jgi:hypothetical protein
MERNEFPVLQEMEPLRMLEWIVTQEMVLKLMAQRKREGRSTSIRTLIREWDLSEAAASGPLQRLWRERLIEATTERPRGRRFRLEPGEELGDLRFRLTDRGTERLAWYSRKRMKEEDRWW